MANSKNDDKNDNSIADDSFESEVESVESPVRPGTSAPPIPYSPSSVSENQKYCWVCFGTDLDDTSASWVRPCKCRGTTKWVHQSCLQRWVDEKQKGGSPTKVACPQCRTEYVVVFPDMGPFVTVLDAIDSSIYRVCPFVSAGIVVGAVYWTAVTYGAVTVMQVVGHRDGVEIMERADPLVLLVGLPAIPVALVVGKMVRWEDTLLDFIRNNLVDVPFVKYVLPFEIDVQPNSTTRNDELPPTSDPVSATRILCGALLLPSLAVLFGRVFFDSVKSNFQRTILGGVTFVAIKGCLKIYHKQQQYVRQCQRRILDYDESDHITRVEANPPSRETSEDLTP